MAEKKKNELAEKLLYAPKNGYDRLSEEEEAIPSKFIVVDVEEY